MKEMLPGSIGLYESFALSPTYTRKSTNKNQSRTKSGAVVLKMESA